MRAIHRRTGERGFAYYDDSGQWWFQPKASLNWQRVRRYDLILREETP